MQIYKTFSVCSKNRTVGLNGLREFSLIQNFEIIEISLLPENFCKLLV